MNGDGSTRRLSVARDGGSYGPGDVPPEEIERALRDHRESGEGIGGRAFAEFIGLRHVAPGVARLTIRPELVNGPGLLIGPVGFALVDYTMGSLLWAQRNPHEQMATINIAVNFVQSSDHGEVECRSTLDRRNRSVAVMSSEIHHDDGRLLLTAVGSFSIWIPREFREVDGGGLAAGDAASAGAGP